MSTRKPNDFKSELKPIWCPGCGDFSVLSSLTKALAKIGKPPEQVAVVSGIGCSSKTPTYFVGGAHGFNSAHGRMPSIVTGANGANSNLTYIGVSGDGDSLSIGLGQFCHAIRRNLRMVYVLENNGVYGLTKGQFSASTDIGSKSKRGEANIMSPIDPARLALTLGATFVARSFSGDKEQLVPILKAAIAHRGFALIDVISPCVTFNDHQGSTKSYLHTRKNAVKATETDFVPPADPIIAHIGEQGSTAVTLHDGSVVRFKSVPKDYDPSDRVAVTSYLDRHQRDGQILTGLLYVDNSQPNMHEMNNTAELPLTRIPYETLCPGSVALSELMDEFR